MTATEAAQILAAVYDVANGTRNVARARELSMALAAWRDAYVASEREGLDADEESCCINALADAASLLYALESGDPILLRSHGRGEDAT